MFAIFINFSILLQYKSSVPAAPISIVKLNFDTQMCGWYLCIHSEMSKNVEVAKFKLTISAHANGDAFF